MQLLVEKVLDLIFPRNTIYNYFHLDSLELKKLENLKLIDIKPKISAKSLKAAYSAFNYVHLKNLISDYKYSRMKYLSGLIASLLISQIENTELKLPSLVTTVPPDPSRLKDRGFNPPEEIARELCSYFSVNFEHLFTKTKSSKSQALKNRNERIKPLQNIELIPESSSFLAGLNSIWIIDDIITTGCTVNSLAELLLEKFPNVEITAISVAYSNKYELITKVDR